MNIIKTLKSSISEKGNYCYSLPVATTKEIIKDVEQLQQENQRLKEIEKEHQRINGDLRVEIKELKEKYMKLEDKYIHNVSCCNEEDCDSFSEHQELKKQLEESKDNYNCLLKQKEQFEYIMSKQVDYQGQQKEFIEYLENEIKRTNPKELDIGELNLRLDDIKFTQYLTYKEVLQKYKEIIGDKE